jgi:hypothetical protein
MVVRCACVAAHSQIHTESVSNHRRAAHALRLIDVAYMINLTREILFETQTFGSTKQQQKAR